LTEALITKILEAGQIKISLALGLNVDSDPRLQFPLLAYFF
jgi:hypothetical protein